MASLTPEMRALVDEQKLGFVATVSEDGRPNLSPKGTIAVWDDDHLAFADLASPRTVANVRARPDVEVNVVDPFVRKGFRFRGRGRLLESGPEWERALAFYERLGVARPRERIHAVVLIRVAEALPLVSPGYDLGFTEDETRERWVNYYERLRRGERPGREPV